MKTEVLLNLLAADARLRVNLGSRLMLGLLSGLACAGALVAALYGLRPDLGQVLLTTTAAKTAVPLIAAVAALAVVRVAARPGAPLRPPMLALAGLIAMIASAFVVISLAKGQEALRAGLGNPMMMMCVTSVMLISTPLLGLLVWALRAGANLWPARSGALAGLAAGAAGVAVYSLACDQDDVLFVIPTYSGAVLMLVIVGALAGQFTLRL